MRCPLCQQPWNPDEEPHVHRTDLARVRRKMARILRANGFSYRQIQRYCGWKSVRSVQEAVEKKR